MNLTANKLKVELDALLACLNTIVSVSLPKRFVTMELEIKLEVLEDHLAMRRLALSLEDELND